MISSQFFKVTFIYLHECVCVRARVHAHSHAGVSTHVHVTVREQLAEIYSLLAPFLVYWLLNSDPLAYQQAPLQTEPLY